jgi:hypothetical protein
LSVAWHGSCARGWLQSYGARVIVLLCGVACAVHVSVACVSCIWKLLVSCLCQLHGVRGGLRAWTSIGTAGSRDRPPVCGGCMRQLHVMVNVSCMEVYLLVMCQLHGGVADLRARGWLQSYGAGSRDRPPILRRLHAPVACVSCMWLHGSCLLDYLCQLHGVAKVAALAGWR